MKLTDKKRTQPTKDEKLAATLLQLRRFDDDSGTFVPLIDREKAKGMTPQDIISAVDFDHWPVAVSLGGTNHPTNLVPKLRADHKKKTAKKDAKVNAKLRRILAAKEEKTRKMAEFYKSTLRGDDGSDSTPTPVSKKKKWPSKPIPGSKSSDFKKPMRGNAVRREKVK